MSREKRKEAKKNSNPKKKGWPGGWGCTTLVLAGVVIEGVFSPAKCSQAQAEIYGAVRQTRNGRDQHFLHG